MAAGKTFSVRGRIIFAAVVVGGLGAAIFGWAATAELAGAVIAPGKVVVEGRPKEIAHRDGGVVAEILVQDGDRVEAGQPLIALEQTQIRADLGVIQAEKRELIGRIARLRAIAAGTEQITFPDDFEAMGPESGKVMASERALFESMRSQGAAVKQQLGLQIEQLGEEIRGLEAQRAAIEEQLTFVRLELDQVRKLYESELTTVERVYTLERQSARMTGDLNGVIAQIARAKGKISEVTVEIANVDQSAQLEAMRELRTAETRFIELREREAAALDRIERAVLHAPEAGYVHELKANTIGGVITPAETVLWIVPAGSRLTVEARIAPTDGEQVQAGGEVTLRFSAYNKEQSPEVQARVLHRSPDVSTDERSGEPYYLAQIEIDEAEIAKIDGLQLIPGMPVEVFVSTGERTALSYFVKPIMDHVERAFREN